MSSSTAKALKSIAFTAAAQEHHISVKTRNILKWLKSGHEVRVQIQGKADRQKAMEAIYNQIEKEVKSGAKMLQKTIKPESIKFNLKPTPEAAHFEIGDLLEGTKSEEFNLDDITAGKDIFSEDFERELQQSIMEDQSKIKKR